eukprot:XP_001695878.1 predicted protein [Chlamydomonas reinhardtii]
MPVFGLTAVDMAATDPVDAPTRPHEPNIPSTPSTAAHPTTSTLPDIASAPAGTYLTEPPYASLALLTASMSSEHKEAVGRAGTIPLLMGLVRQNLGRHFFSVVQADGSTFDDMTGKGTYSLAVKPAGQHAMAALVNLAELPANRQRMREAGIVQLSPDAPGCILLPMYKPCTPPLLK